MRIDTDNGILEITDTELTFTGGHDEDVSVPLTPSVPEYTFTRGVDGDGALVIGGKVIPLPDEHGPAVVAELRKRGGTPGTEQAPSADRPPERNTAPTLPIDAEYRG